MSLIEHIQTKHEEIINDMKITFSKDMDEDEFKYELERLNENLGLYCFNKDLLPSILIELIRCLSEKNIEHFDKILITQLWDEFTTQLQRESK